MRYLAPLVGLVLLGAALASGPVSAQPYGPPYGPRQGVQSGQVRSLGEIVNDIRRQHPGNIADVQGPNIGPFGEPHYRLKWVSPDGRVQWLDTDARTGRVLGIEGPGPGPGIYPNGGGRRGGFLPRGQNIGPPIIVSPRGPGFGRGPGPGFGRGPGPGFGRGPGPGVRRGPGPGAGRGPGNRSRGEQ